MVPRRSRERRARRLRPRSRLRLRPPPGVETRRLEEPSKPSRRRREPAAARGRRAARRPRRVQVANQIRGAPRGDGGDERPRRAEAGSGPGPGPGPGSRSLVSLLAADAERDARGRGRGRRRRVRDYLLESSLEKHSSAGVLPSGRTQGLIPRRAALRAPRVGGGDERGFARESVAKARRDGEPRAAYPRGSRSRGGRARRGADEPRLQIVRGPGLGGVRAGSAAARGGEVRRAERRRRRTGAVLILLGNRRRDRRLEADARGLVGARERRRGRRGGRHRLRGDSVERAVRGRRGPVRGGRVERAAAAVVVVVVGELVEMRLGHRRVRGEATGARAAAPRPAAPRPAAPSRGSGAGSGGLGRGLTRGLTRGRARARSARWTRTRPRRARAPRTTPRARRGRGSRERAPRGRASPPPRSFPRRSLAPVVLGFAAREGTDPPRPPRIVPEVESIPVINLSGVPTTPATGSRELARVALSRPRHRADVPTRPRARLVNRVARGRNPGARVRGCDRRGVQGRAGE